jgi:hypothetical protein
MLHLPAAAAQQPRGVGGTWGTTAAEGLGTAAARTFSALLIAAVLVLVLVLHLVRSQARLELIGAIALAVILCKQCRRAGWVRVALASVSCVRQRGHKLDDRWVQCHRAQHIERHQIGALRR